MGSSCQSLSAVFDLESKIGNSYLNGSNQLLLPKPVEGHCAVVSLGIPAELTVTNMDSENNQILALFLFSVFHKEKWMTILFFRK